MLRQNATIGVITGRIYLFMPFRRTCKLENSGNSACEEETFIQVYFKSVDHEFCCSEHFRPTDFKVIGHRWELKKDQFPPYLSGHQKR